MSPKAVILAGGFGTRLSEETSVRPKPMVEIGGRPILWHIMKSYAVFGVNEFVICCGYKAEVIKEYFATYHLRGSDLTVDLRSSRIEYHPRDVEPWLVHLVDTGDRTMTGGRLKRVADLVGEGTFFFTYGDCVSTVDMRGLLELHLAEGALATLTAVKPPGRFGAVTIAEGRSRITSFREKPDGDGAWINGGFFVLEPEALEYVESDDTVWEREPMEHLAAAGRLAAYRHHGFWQNMDSLRDKMVLEELWASENPPWKLW